MQIQFAITELLSTEKVFFTNCHEVPYTCSNTGVFQSLYSLSVHCSRGMRVEIMMKYQNHDPFTSELKVQVQIVVRCGIVCTTARFS